MIRPKQITSLLVRVLITFPYLYGMIDMIFRFCPPILLNLEVTPFWQEIIEEYFVYYNMLQYIPHFLFLGLYAGIVRSSNKSISYFLKYYSMQYLVLFTAEQLVYDIFLRTCFTYLDTPFALTMAFVCVASINLLAIDCVISIIQGRYTEIPLITDAVLVHIGDRRNSN